MGGTLLERGSRESVAFMETTGRTGIFKPTTWEAGEKSKEGDAKP